MKELHHVIYVPGLGDEVSHGQDKALGLWRAYGLTPHYHPVGWADGEAFNPKLERLIGEIDDLAETGDVSLVGTSAGGSAVLHAYASRPDIIRGVGLICAKVRNPQTVSNDRLRANPAFRGSLVLLPHTLIKLGTEERQRIISKYPLRDTVVPPDDTVVEGAERQLIPMVGHSESIAYALTLGSFGMTRFLKRQHSRINQS